MYVSTYYSFKGGVGRTMALANSAVALAQRGRRVLVVDFDLEAPGLDTFELFRPGLPQLGLINFVHDYLVSGIAPDVTPYVFKAPSLTKDSADIWVMPSGAQLDTYAAQFNDIDWVQLYSEMDGYLLFEDLRLQWQTKLNLDYVLIDSRTGHTDTGGICTRQLPDAVVLFFFPNDQNLRGLTKVVRDIRAEPVNSGREKIQLHFVMSNVPDLDDEDQILESKRGEFRERLEMDADPLMVHRYDSLSLLNQVLFAYERPRSRLADEYRALVDAIVRHNLKDRSAAVKVIGQALKRHSGVVKEKAVLPLMDTADNLRKIERFHSSDSQVMALLGLAKQEEGDLFEAERLFTRALELGHRGGGVYLSRAEIRSVLGLTAAANSDAIKSLEYEHRDARTVYRAIQFATSGQYAELANARAVKKLSDEDSVWLAWKLAGSGGQLTLSAQILQPLWQRVDELTEQRRREVESALAMRLLGLGKCWEASEILTHKRARVDTFEFGDMFNLGMALWGSNKGVEIEPFERVIELDAEKNRDSVPIPHADYHQRIAIAYWAIGSSTASLEHVSWARGLIESSIAEYSVWRYYKVYEDEFVEDLNELVQLVRGNSRVVPRFMRSKGTLQ